jgi:methylenetetrahydrofolate reductase (NADPH)
MKFTDLYSKGFQYSLEVFPPKTEKGIENLIIQLKKLEQINPAYVSVTYGAMGTTRDMTKELAFKLYDEIQAYTAFHFTCVGSSRHAIKEYVDLLYDKGINLVLALRGDWPNEQVEQHPMQDGFSYANELMAYLKELHNFSIAVAGYPEKHPEACSMEEDIDYLKRKVDTGAEVILTQLFYNNDYYYDWLEKVRKAGVSIPIVPGIMPIMKLSQVQRITNMCGAKMPQTLLEQLEQCGDDEDAMRDVGVTHAITQCQDLKKQGVPGIHFYCLNKAYSVLKIVEAM